jgi:hypothetical protein
LYKRHRSAVSIAPIAGAIAVIAGKVDRCTVNGEQVIPQPVVFTAG